jgi:hypothetical protein
VFAAAAKLSDEQACAVVSTVLERQLLEGADLSMACGPGVVLHQ